MKNEMILKPGVSEAAWDTCWSPSLGSSPAGAGGGRKGVGPAVQSLPPSLTTTQAAACFSRHQGPWPWAESAPPGRTLTHGLVEEQEALVEASCPVLRGGRCTEGQPQTVP